MDDRVRVPEGDFIPFRKPCPRCGKEFLARLFGNNDIWITHADDELASLITEYDIREAVALIDQATNEMAALIHLDIKGE